MNILLVDDEPLSREAIGEFLTELGHQLTQCSDGADAWQSWQQGLHPLVISDIRMPSLTGIELLQKIKQSPQGRYTDVILLTGYADVTTAIQALRCHAYDFLRKPVDVEELATAVARSGEHLALLRENLEFKHRFSEKLAHATQETHHKLQRIENAYAELVGIGKVGIFSQAMRNVTELAEKFHQSRDVPVLIEGETGTGKEVVAKLVHYGQGSVTSPFISINCSAISANLFESELFGYEGGTFTGAKKTGMMGKFELAQGGSLFLDEIGDLPLELQPKLLRVLQEREIYRIGGLKKIQLDVRIICATNRDLKKITEQGLFRKDLLFRLNMGRIYLPPLRERTEDIAALAQMFLLHYSEQKKRRFRLFHKDAIKVLEGYSWPGNVRELQNSVERLVLLYDGIEVLPKHLSFLHSDSCDLYSGSNELRLGEIILPAQSLNLQALEAEIVKKALAMHNSNRTKTAEYLGITRSSLRSKIKKL